MSTEGLPTPTSGKLPDPTGAVGEGPLAQKFAPAVKAMEQAEREQAEQEWRENAKRLVTTLVEAGETENDARMMLGLEPLITGPDDDPRPWVTYYVPKEDPTGGEPGATAIAPSLVAMCDLCGAVVGSVAKHYSYAHPDEEIPTTGETP
jgi:hypothetical protein